MATTKSTRNPPRKPNSTVPVSPAAQSIQLQLRTVAGELRDVLATLAVAARALRDQNADIDMDVAVVLQRNASAPLFASIEIIEALLDEPEGGGAGGKKVIEKECVH